MNVQPRLPAKPAPPPQQRLRMRSGYTLLELVLVLALIVIVMAIAFPSLDSMYGYYRVSAAADTVRAAWALARSHAIEEGRAYRFSIVPGGSSFKVAPDSDAYWSGDSPPAENNQGGEPPLVQQESLPEGVTFADPKNPTTPSADGAPAGGDFQTIATFLPDGTALDDVSIAFQSRGTRSLVLQLRGLTGVITLKPQDMQEE